MKSTLFAVCAFTLFGAGYIFGQSQYDWQAHAAPMVGNVAVPRDISTNADFAPFWKAWQILDAKIAANKVASTSTSTITKIDDQEKVWGAISGLAASYNDPYTMFFPPVQAKAFSESVKGAFGGVGMEVGFKDKIITVVSPLKNTPAAKAGLKPNDRILKINDVSTINLALDKAVGMMRGDPGTTVKITIFRESERREFEVTITRAIIQIPTIETEFKNGVFIIRLFSFTESSASKFQDALKEFQKYQTTKMIVDLRGNPGGYLESAVDIASFFLPEGKVVVSEEGNRHLDNKIYRSKGFNVFNDKLQAVVLIDGGSASASEILAAALRDHNKAILLGEKSFGKGSVQELVEITKDTSLKVTIARWLTPSGFSISNGGLTPDIIVAASTSTEDIIAGKDVQLERALQELNK